MLYKCRMTPFWKQTCISSWNSECCNDCTGENVLYSDSFGFELFWIHIDEKITITSISMWKAKISILKNYFLFGTSLVAQWLRIHLPMQGTWVQVLVREDPTCCGATKPIRHNYWTCALEPASHNYWSPCAKSPCSTTKEATAMRSPCTATKSSPRSPQLEKARVQQRRPNAAKKNYFPSPRKQHMKISPF